MLNINLRDERFDENYKSMKELQSFGYSDEEIQKLYDSQLKKDLEDKQ